jgi:hypothetical protein
MVYGPSSRGTRIERQAVSATPAPRPHEFTGSMAPRTSPGNLACNRREGIGLTMPWVMERQSNHGSAVKQASDGPCRRGPGQDHHAVTGHAASLRP